VDDRLCPIPIPDARAGTRYRDILPLDGVPIAKIVEDLTHRRVKGSDRAHLDPDLRRGAIARGAGWRPIFGQAGAAQSHLARNGVGAGDLFLFFGCFRRAEKIAGAFRFVRSAPKLHVLFGWMQVARVERVTRGLAAEIPWVSGHPHLAEPERFKNNTLYFASEQLSSIGVAVNGGGMFERIRPELILTQTDPYVGCSIWSLPRWFAPGRRPALSYHSKAARWTECSTSVRLRSAYPGQEFVLDVEEYPEAREWVRAIFGAGG
jgi:hypothetical protein